MNYNISPKLENAITVFGRFLRQAGCSLGTGQIMESIRAVSFIEIEAREDFRQALKSCLISDYKLTPLFDQLFDIYWRNPDKIENVSNMLKRLNESNSKEYKKDFIRENIEDIYKKKYLENSDSNQIENSSDDVDVHLFSPFEQLKEKRFDHYSDEELDQAKKILQRRNWSIPTRKLRRYRPGKFSNKIDIRNTIRDNIFPSQDFICLSWKQFKVKERPLVVLMDISASMDMYTRVLIHFIHVLYSSGKKIESFTFGTRLTRITQHLRYKNVNDSIKIINSLVKDWSGGTKIGETIGQFNLQWARRVLGNGAIVLIITDGWDTGNNQLLDREFGRLHRSCRKLIWLNPNLGYQDFEPITSGVQIIMKHIDEFLPIHNLKCLEDLDDVFASFKSPKKVWPSA